MPLLAVQRVIFDARTVFITYRQYGGWEASDACIAIRSPL
jgi:hypothetical protein